MSKHMKFTLWMPSGVEQRNISSLQNTRLLESSLEPCNLFPKELNGLNWLKYAKGCSWLEAMPVWDGACELQHYASPSWLRSRENRHQIVVFRGRNFRFRQVVFTGDNTPPHPYKPVLCWLLNQHILPAWAVLQNRSKVRIKYSTS